jgi:hypothetical protein
MEMVSKPYQDRFLHTILVHSIIEKKEIMGKPNGAHQKNIQKQNLFLFSQVLLKYDESIVTLPMSLND